MLLNSDQRPWLTVTFVFTAVASLAYASYVASTPYGPSGGSWPGLFFGILGTTFMVLAGLLAARKKVRTWRIGSAQVWMRMHIWLSLMAVPCIWFHSGFELGGPLTTLLMVLFYIVIVSGIVGLILQQFLPATMTRRVPLETIHFQIEHVAGGLAADAYEQVASVTGPIAEAAEEQERLRAEEEIVKLRAGYWKAVARLRPAEEPEADANELQSFYLASVRPYLKGLGRGPAPDFQTILRRAPEGWLTKIEKLQAICEEARQLGVQKRLHGLLHNWLFFHAPVSFAMFVLAGFHAVLALRY
jgi:hypothetical protein